MIDDPLLGNAGILTYFARTSDRISVLTEY